MKSLQVIKAIYVAEYKIHIYFNDGTDRIVDFENYLFNYEYAYPEYRTLSKFKTFKVDKGELVWGKNWDIIFPVHKLYSGSILRKSQGAKSKPYLSFEV